MTNRKKIMLRRIEITKFIRKFGLWNVDRNAFAKKHGVSVHAIDKDLQFIKKHYSMDLINCEEIKFELHDGLKELLSQARLKALSGDDDSQRMKWARTYAKLAGQFITFLEDFGVKEKVADKLLVNNAKDVVTLEDFERAALLLERGIVDENKE